MNIFKSFVTSLRRYKMATALNILGLTVAFASFIILMMQVWYELGYDRQYPDAKNIYELNLSDEPSLDVIKRPLGEKLIHASADIEAGGCYSYAHSGRESRLFRPQEGKESAKITTEFACVSRPFLDVFSFRAVAGDFESFPEPGSGIIPKSLAGQLFGNENAVGQTIGCLTGESDPTYLKITAVYEDFPVNASLKNDIYTDLGEKLLHDFNNSSTVYFLRIKPSAEKEKIERTLRSAVWDFEETYEQDTTRTEPFSLVSLNDLYFSGETLSGDGGSRNITYSLLSVAIMILLISAINFLNFAVAQTPARIRGINTQKVFGCSTRQLRFNLTAEAVCTVLLSFLIALLVVYALKDTRLSSGITGGISLANYPLLVWMSAGIALLTGIAAGVYPAFYATSFTPAMVLKGSFAVSKAGKRLRLTLISVQFVVSSILIIAALSIYMQNRYIRRFDIGLPRENIVTLDLESLARQSVPYIQKLKSNPDITDVTLSDNFIVSEFQNSRGRTYKNQDIDFCIAMVSPNFVSFMNLNLLEGRNFEETDLHKGSLPLIFNETAKREFGLTVPDRIEEFEAVGIVEDFHAKPLNFGIVPFALCINQRYSLDCAYVKIDNPDPTSAIEFIKTTYKEMSPSGQIPEIKFMDEQLGNLYQKQQQLLGQITLFSLISILISMIGVFGIIYFETNSRRKEIALRKVYGSQTGEILWMFNRTYIRVILICFAAAAPAAYYLVKRWLENFAYQTPIGIWIFIAALLAILLITVTTITLQSYKTASENPANSIRTE